MPQPWEQYQDSVPTMQPWEQFGGQSAMEPSWTQNVSNIFSGDPHAALQGVSNIYVKPLNTVIGDVMGAAMSPIAPMANRVAGAMDSTSAGRWIGDKLMGVQNAVAPIVSDAASLADTTGSKLVDMVAGVPQQPDGTISDLVKGSPQLQQDLAATGQFAKLGGNLLGMKGIGAVDASALDNISGFKGSASHLPGAAPLTPEMLNTAAPAAYKAVDSANTGFTPAFTNKTLAILEKAKQPAIAGKVLTSENADINSALGEYSALKDTPLTLKDYQQIDSTLGNKAAQAYVKGDSNKARIISDAQDSIREMVKPENLNTQDITGSPEGINTLTQHAIPLWSVKAKVADLQKIVDNANLMPNPKTAMQTGFRTLMKSKKFAAYPPEIQQAISKVAVQGVPSDLLGVIGSRLNPIVAGAAGGPAAAVMAQGTSLGARMLTNKLINNKADNVINSMLETVRPSIEKFANDVPAQPSFKPAGLLPAPVPLPIDVNTAGVAVTGADRQILGQAPASPYEPTLQEIQKMPFDQGKAALDNYFRRKNTRR